MPRIISVNSFLGGTGKTTLIANLAVLWAEKGRTVGVIDANIADPSLHYHFGLAEGTGCRLNNYLRGECELREAVHDVTPRLPSTLTGRVLLIPSDDEVSEIGRITQESVAFDPLGREMLDLFDELGADVLLVDTPVGLNDPSLSLMALSDAAAIVLRLDQRNFLGTSVTLDLLRRLGVARIVLVVNPAPRLFNPADIKTRAAETYGSELVSVLPYSDELTMLPHPGIFALSYPNHSLTSLMREMADSLAG